MIASWRVMFAVIQGLLFLAVLFVLGARAQAPPAEPAPATFTSVREAFYGVLVLIILAVGKGIVDYFTQKRAGEKVDDVKRLADAVASALVLANEKVDQVKVAAESVAADLAKSKEEKIAKNAMLDAKLDQAVNVAATTHTLVNSTHGVLLREKAVLARQIADMTKAGPAKDAASAAADLAEKALAAHDARQAIVDAAGAS